MASRRELVRHLRRTRRMAKTSRKLPAKKNKARGGAEPGCAAGCRLRGTQAAGPGLTWVCGM